MTAYEVATHLAAIVGAEMWSDSTPSWALDDDKLGVDVRCRVYSDTCGPRVVLMIDMMPSDAEVVLRALNQKMEEER